MIFQTIFKRLLHFQEIILTLSLMALACLTVTVSDLVRDALYGRLGDLSDSVYGPALLFAKVNGHDMPVMKVEHHAIACKTNPLGVKGTGEAGSCTLHQLVGAEGVHCRCLCRADLGDRVAVVHQDSQTTTAAAMPASWVIERWMLAMPRSATRAATVPVQAK